MLTVEMLKSSTARFLVELLSIAAAAAVILVLAAALHLGPSYLGIPGLRVCSCQSSAFQGSYNLAAGPTGDTVVRSVTLSGIDTRPSACGGKELLLVVQARRGGALAHVTARAPTSGSSVVVYVPDIPVDAVAAVHVGVTG